MSSDEPIFLVSQCGTPEEFLAAFRRYVDRHGLFVPTATPAPAMRSGTFALTLADGSILVEGDADIVSSSPHPSALYGRTGMTMHFTSVDEPSKVVLAALEKAKLSIKAPAGPVDLPTRPSRLREPVSPPATKASTGSADRTQALAQCVLVGDVTQLTAARTGKPTVAKAGPRFVIPQIQTTSSASPAGARTGGRSSDAAPVDATEVGPIIEESAIVASGPTVTSLGFVAPLPPDDSGRALEEVDATINAPLPGGSAPTKRPSSAELRAPSASSRSNGRAVTGHEAHAIPAMPTRPPTESRSVSGNASSAGRTSSPQLRRTVLGLAAMHVDPAPVEAIPSLDDADAVPEAVHDSMFETEAVPEPTDARATQRVGAPRLPPRRASTSAASPPAPPPMRRMTQPRMEAMPESGADSGALGGAARAALPTFSAPAGSLSTPVRAATAPLPPMQVRPSSPPGRLGKSSESVPATRESASSIDGGPSLGTPRRMPTAPSMPTVPIRPPTMSPDSEPMIPSGRAGSSPAIPSGSTSFPSAAIPSEAIPSEAIPSELAPPSAGDEPLVGDAATAPADDDGDWLIPVSELDGTGDELNGAAPERTPARAPANPLPGLPFVDTASVSEPLAAAAPSRPPMLDDILARPGFSDDASPAAPLGLENDTGPQAQAQRLDDEPPQASPLGDDDGDQAAPASDESARHARARQAAIDAKVEIDPALFAESAIAKSFESNFDAAAGDQPPGWHAPQAPWEDPNAAASAAAPAPYGYVAPAQAYQAPAYPPVYPVAFHSGDETALVMVPDVGRRRSFVILGSAILVLVVGFALYMLLDRAQQGDSPTATPDNSAATPQPGTSVAQPVSTEVGGGAPSAQDRDDASAAAAAGTDAPAATDQAPTAAVASCSTELVSEPAGATVLLDGQALGVTPFTAALPCHPLTLTFRRAGSADLVKELTPAAATKAVSVELLAATIEITITTNPPGAHLKLDDADIGRSPKTRTVPLGVPVTISASKSGRSAASVVVTPDAKSRKFNLVLKAIGRAPKATGRPRKPANRGNGLDDL